jgi:hypothetical protein
MIGLFHCYGPECYGRKKKFHEGRQKEVVQATLYGSCLDWSEMIIKNHSQDSHSDLNTN